MEHPCSIIARTSLTQGDLFSLVGIVLLIICSAFFSASETAYSSSNSLRLKTLAEEKTKGARKAIYIAENFERTLSCILTFNNLVNIACTSIAGYLFAKFIVNPTLANLLNTIILTIVILIFGEILPKAKAKKNPENTALKYSSILYFLLKYSYIYYPFYWLQKATCKKKKDEVDAPTVTEDELESIIDTMEEEGVIDHNNREIIQGAINLSDLSAYDVMTHRKEAVFININASIDEIKRTFVEHQYSRIPVFKETRDNVVGILNQKDLFSAILTNKKLMIEKLMTKPHFVSEEMKLDDLIRELQKEKKHLAIVLDEQGGTSGIVTMEDCLESIFGEIYDEHDEEENTVKIKQNEDGSYIIDADTEIDELFDTLQIEHKPETNYPTVGGFIFEIAEDLCAINDEIRFDTIDEQIDEHGNFINKQITMIFTILKINNRKIQQVKLNITSTIEED